MPITPLNLTLLAVDRDAREDLLAAMPTLVPVEDGDHLTLGEVIGLGRTARPVIGEMDGWTILVDTLFQVPDQAEVVHRATRGRNGYAFLWQAASGSHGFGAHHDGISARSAFRSGGDWMIDQGEPLPEEGGLDWEADPEAALTELASRLTGLDLADDGIWEIPFTPLRKAPKGRRMEKMLGR